MDVDQRHSIHQHSDTFVRGLSPSRGLFIPKSPSVIIVGRAGAKSELHATAATSTAAATDAATASEGAAATAAATAPARAAISSTAAATATSSAATTTGTKKQYAKQHPDLQFEL